jgi:hypothetical protein
MAMIYLATSRVASRNKSSKENRLLDAWTVNVGY